MPRKPPLACRHPWCGKTQPCPDHPLPEWSAGTPGPPMAPGWDGRRARIMARDGFTCRQCGSPAAVVDHLVPRYLGGTDDDGNLQALCQPCSDAKTQAEARAARGQ